MLGWNSRDDANDAQSARFGGGSVLATWLAVSPNHGVPVTEPAAAVRRPASAAEPTAEELNLQAGAAAQPHCRRHAASVDAQSFQIRYVKIVCSARASRERERSTGRHRAGHSSRATLRPPLKLSGVAQKGATRTAILSGDGQIYVVGVGESVAGRYTVITIDPEAVLLRDAAGAEQRLVLPQ